MEGGTVEGGQEVQKGISPWFKKSCAHRERACCVQGGGAGGSLEGCVSVLPFFVCSMQRQVCHIQYSCLSGLRIPKQPVWEYTDAPASPPPPPTSPSRTASALFSPFPLLAHMAHCFNCYSSDKTDICF